jgi:hypothetical protein
MLKATRSIIFFMVFLIASTLTSTSICYGDNPDVELVVELYIASLANGDVLTIEELTGEKLGQTIRSDNFNIEQYGYYLRNLYGNVSMRIISILPVAEDYRAVVEFIYPEQDKQVHVFILSNINGFWKITDEKIAYTQ